jgi:hypothetical protein
LFGGTIALFLAAIASFYYWIGSGRNGPGAVTEAERESPSERDARRIGDMHDLAVALSMYYKDHSTYPETPPPQNCAAPYNNLSGLSAALVPEFLKVIAKDPSPEACEYNYLYWSDGKNYVIMMRLETVNPAEYADRWCIGASGGTIPASYKYWKRCPSPEHS